MDHDTRKRLTLVIEKLTKSKQMDLDQLVLHELKSLVKENNENVKSAYDLLIQQLKTNNSKVYPFSSFVVLNM